MIAKDYHSLWLNSAALALAGGDLEVAGGVVERDELGEPTGVLREEAAWRFKERHLAVPDDVYLDAMRAGLKVAAARGVTAVHDKDGWLGALGLWQQLEQAGQLTLRVWQSLPHSQVEGLRALGIRSGFGSPLLRVGYLKAFMDGTLGSGTALMLDGSGVRITSSEELAEIVLRGAECRLPGGSPCDRRRRQSRGPRRLRKDAVGRGPRSASATGSNMRSSSHPKISPASRSSASPARCSSRTPRRIATSPTTSGPGRPAAHTPIGRCGSREQWSRTDPTPRSRSSTRSPASVQVSGGRSTSAPPWHPEQALTVQQAFEATTVAPSWLTGDERRRGRLLPGYAADLVVLDRDPWDDLDAEVVATMVAGRWVHNPPPWH